MKRTERLLRIGELAEQCGVSVRTLRYYEEVGLLPPTTRSEAGYRLYDQGAVARLQAILRMKALGLNLSDIFRLTQVHQEAGRCAPVRENLVELLSDLVQRLEEQIHAQGLFVQDLRAYLSRARTAPEAFLQEECSGAATRRGRSGGAGHDPGPGPRLAVRGAGSFPALQHLV